ncbi:RpiB/LacA/LacB family sugar-phosphate isomerase [Clostridium sp. BNL1100]|uniref:RpiB/LacA/LacB family sugar-phosphate isomerase n=1 Tax=Clostridium sp. BNL1100 TaxID=755731 RepID=UPI00024A7983|nr:RpiB/LacA/LacB family sugar-phosphate isomerase [Clostridium sp. BNL1100]AEY66984.1 sugar-phosphate isomerase, RpiB/LacA/LacB family [Clostridium sp. BNL1100]
MKKIIIGSDKSGFPLKEAIKAHLTQLGYEVTDGGTLKEEEPKPYFEVASAVAKRVSDGEFERAVLICGTGMGVSIVANKYKGVYAAVCENTYAAEKARAINDANILCLGGWLTAEFVGCAMVDTFLNTEFTQNLEEWRAKNLRNARIQVKNIEDEIYK